MQCVRAVKISMYYEVTFELMYTTGFIALFTTQVMCQEFSRCYNDVNICLWIDGSLLSQSAAQVACHQRDNSFLPRVTNRNIQDKLREFRSDANRHSSPLLGGNGFWIDVTAGVITIWHWVDGSELAG